MHDARRPFSMFLDNKLVFVLTEEAKLLWNRNMFIWYTFGYITVIKDLFLLGMHKYYNCGTYR